MEEIPKPSRGPGEILIKIRASAVQPHDILTSKAAFPNTIFSGTLGRDFAGTVVEGPPGLFGKNVFGTSGSTFSFTVDGAKAEYAALPADAVAMMPDGLTFEQAALMGTPVTIALITLTRVNYKSKDVVLVLGATGSVGSWVAKMALPRGCKVVGVGRHGTDIDSTQDSTLSGALQLTGGKGPDIVVDTVGDLKLAKAAFAIRLRMGASARSRRLVPAALSFPSMYFHSTREVSA